MASSTARLMFQTRAQRSSIGALMLKLVGLLEGDEEGCAETRRDPIGDLEEAISKRRSRRGSTDGSDERSRRGFAAVSKEGPGVGGALLE